MVQTVQCVESRAHAKATFFTMLCNAALAYGIMAWASPSLASGFSNAASLADARAGHTATLLPSGKVLVAGGVSEGYLASAELYDPASNMWSAAGSMASPRSGHTATLLPSGKVLVAGGTPSGPLASAELYDPGSNTWSVAASMATARYGHTATLLTSGQVLVAGGYGTGFLALASAELYDPGRNTWSVAASMATARFDYTATLLPSGQVLVAGGYANGPLASAELYDSGSNTWSAAGSIATARYSHTATLLTSGQVLVAGGRDGRSMPPFNITIILQSAELYDPRNDRWSDASSMVTSGLAFTATLLASGHVLVAGGASTGGISNPPVTFAGAGLYDPASNMWSAVASMASARAGHTATLLLSGKVLVAGGGNSVLGIFIYLTSAELYDPNSGGALLAASEIPTLSAWGMLMLALLLGAVGAVATFHQRT